MQYVLQGLSSLAHAQKVGGFVLSIIFDFECRNRPLSIMVISADTDIHSNRRWFNWCASK